VDSPDSPTTRKTATSAESLPAVSGFSHVLTTILAIVKTLICTIFSIDATQAINRTAVFLIFFSVVHCAGNMFIFVGPDAFNGYGYFLHINPLLKFIEAYLALGLIIHTIVALFLTYRKWATVVKQPLVYGKLIASGVFIIAFIVVHLLNFRFSDKLTSSDETVIKDYMYKTQQPFTIPLKGTVPAGTEMKDLYKLVVEKFSDQKEVAFYVITISVLGFHMWTGWAKSVFKMKDIPKDGKKVAALFGQVVVLLTTIGFVSIPIYVHTKLQN
jgi:succinate dehydrogenase / fumarate reductase cytochrome b subunit